MRREPAGAALLLVAVVIGALVAVSVPADGVRVDVDSSADFVDRGETVTLTTEILIRKGEAIPIDGIELRLEGPQSSTATFGVDGAVRTDRPWLRSVERTFDNASYALRPSRYGYDERADRNVSFGSGRGYGDNAAGTVALRYAITVDTEPLPAGGYTVATRVVASGGTATHTYASDPAPVTIEEDGGSPATGTPADGVPVEDPGVGALDVTILLAVVLILFGAGYYGIGPVYQWYRNR